MVECALCFDLFEDKQERDNHSRTCTDMKVRPSQASSLVLNQGYGQGRAYGQAEGGSHTNSNNQSGSYPNTYESIMHQGGALISYTGQEVSNNQAGSYPDTYGPTTNDMHQGGAYGQGGAFQWPPQAEYPPAQEPQIAQQPTCTCGPWGLVCELHGNYRET